MTRTKAFQACEATARDKICQSLRDQLKMFSPNMLAKRGSNKALDDILGLAIDIHKSMRCSSESYVLRKPDNTELWTRADLNQWILRLSGTWSTVPLDENFVPYVGLIPGLYKERHSDDNSSLLLLVKPVVLGYHRGLTEEPRAVLTSVDDRERVIRESDRRESARRESARRESERQRKKSPFAVRNWITGVPRSYTS